jgi:hypothetical protein
MHVVKKNGKTYIYLHLGLTGVHKMVEGNDVYVNLDYVKKKKPIRVSFSTSASWKEVKIADR